MAKFKIILERALKDSKAKNSVSESMLTDEDELDVSSDDIFDEEIPGAPETDVDFFSLEAEPVGSDIEFDEEGAKAELGDNWFTKLKEPIEQYLKEKAVFTKENGEVDKTALETALTELFTNLGISNFTGNIVDDGSIKVSMGAEEDAPEAEEDLLKVDGVEDEIVAEDYEGETVDPSLEPMNDSEEHKGNAEIIQLDVEWDGTAVGVGDMEVEYADEEAPAEEEAEEEPEDDEESEEEDEEEVFDDDDSFNEELNAEEILKMQDQIDAFDAEDSFGESLEDGGAKAEKVGNANASLKPGSYKFNNGTEGAGFEAGAEDLTAVDSDSSASEPKVSGDYFMQHGKFDGMDAPTAVDNSIDVSKPDMNFRPEGDDHVEDLEKVDIKEAFEFDNGGEMLDVGDENLSDIIDLKAELNPDAEPEQFVKNSKTVPTNGEEKYVGLTEFGDGDTPLTGMKDIEDFLGNGDEETIDGAPEQLGSEPRDTI